MLFFKKLIVAAACIYFGYIILRHRKQVMEWTGSFLWAEQYLGRGGTGLVLGAIGAGLIFFWFGYPFGTFDHWFEKPMTPNSTQQTTTTSTPQNPR